ncbi:hypothetical protein [Saccharothrix deserti]|uniref:hypothetical protein n=1 Tax=Saccharothrix deserti TaxID=2593674 RepID=UPI00192E6077|nr:hypothetical protein [Saccharothrix deserti]
MATDRFVHMGTKSWWNGITKTLCGLRYQGGDRVLFPRLGGYTICPACKTVQQADKR